MLPRPLYFHPAEDRANTSLKEAAFVLGCIFPPPEESWDGQKVNPAELEHLESGCTKVITVEKRMFHVSKPLLINDNMEGQDTGVVDAILHCGMLHHSQNPFGLVKWLVGHSMPLPWLYIPGPPGKVAPALQMSLNCLQKPLVAKGWDKLPPPHSTKHFV